jgi:2-iminobutanoate/2-iminopropanoate deaminase
MSLLIKTINTKLGPKAIGPYSTIKIYNGLMFVSGAIGVDPKSGNLVSDRVEDQVRRAIDNLKLILD